MIGAAHQMDTSGYTIPYVSTWAARVDGKEPVEIVKATGERVRKTALTILDQLDTAQVSDGTPPGLDREARQRDQPARDQPARERSAPERADSRRRVEPLPAPDARSTAGTVVVQGREL